MVIKVSELYMNKWESDLRPNFQFRGEQRKSYHEKFYNFELFPLKFYVKFDFTEFGSDFLIVRIFVYFL